MRTVLTQRKMACMTSSTSVEILLAEDTLALIAKMGGFVYFLNRTENEMIRMAKIHFSIILWMIRAFKRSQMKISHIKDMTQNLKNLTKLFYFKKCAIHKEIENCQTQAKRKIELVRRTKNLAQDVGQSVKKAAREAALRSSLAAAQRPKGTNIKEISELEYFSLSLAEMWWALMENCMKLADDRMMSVQRTLKILENKRKWEKLLTKLFLHAAIAAQFGKMFQKKLIIVKNMEIEKTAMIHQRYQMETVCCKALEEFEVMEFLSKELKSISEVILSEFSPQEKVEN